MRSRQNSYVSLLVLGALLSVASIGSILIPLYAKAFWPFSTSLAASEGDAPIVHDASIALLEAATNSDPNPSKQGDVLALTSGSALMPNAGMDGSGAPSSELNLDSLTPVSSGGGSITRYTVQPGDSLSEIAANNNVSLNTILWANDIKDPKKVVPGMSLVILPVSGLQHTVVKGETLASVAKKYSADASDIASYNGLDDTASLAAGTAIIIPGGELPAAPAKTPSKVASVKKTSSSSGSTAELAQLKVTTSTVVSHSTTGNPYRGGSGAALSGFFVNPVPGALVTQGIHGWNGIDLGAHTGTPIRAAAGGTVIIAKSGGYNGGYGSYVVISHDNGTQTLYSHMSSMQTSVGASVSAGEVIGLVGTTGDATGPHLHFEVRGARNPFADCTVMTVCSPE